MGDPASGRATKARYLDVLGLVEPCLRPGALVVADDADRSPCDLARIRSPAGPYLSTPFATEVELSGYHP